MINVKKELRALYRSTRQMVRSNDVNVFPEWLVEDIAANTDFERTIILWLSKSPHTLEFRADYGYRQSERSVHYGITFDQTNDLLHKVYMEREPFHVQDLSTLETGDHNPQC